MKRFWNVFFPCCLRANDDYPGDYPRGVQGRSEHPVIPEAPKPNADTLENLQKQLNIEMQVRKGAENLILAYSKAPSKKKKHRKAAQRMHQDCVNKIQVLQTLILQAQKETCETSVSAPAPEEAPEIDAITSLGAELGESPVKDIEAMILEDVFEVASDVSSPASEEAPGVELEASLEKDIEAILEKILEDVFELVSDVSSPASEEASGVELEAAPEKDIETILEKILEDVFELVSDVSSPVLEEASGVELEASLEKDIEAILEKILEDVFELVSDVSSPALEEASGVELEATPEKDIEAILEKILEDVFELVSDVSSPALEEAPGVELEASLEKDIEAILEKILEDVFELVSDVSSPALEEAPGVELEASPEKDIETILEKILEDVFEIVTDTQSSPQPEPEEASAPTEASSPAHLSEPTPDIQIPVELPQETAAAPVITTEPEIPESSVENIIHEDPEAGGAQSQVNISLEDFRCCTMLGKGSFGKVLLAEYTKSNRFVALKAQNKIDLIRYMKVHRVMGEKEVFQAISSRQHPFLVNLFASFQTETHTIFAMEYVAGGNLETQLKNTPEGLPKPRAVFYAACITLGVEYLHQLNIVHRDLKAENIMIDQEGFAKITDFGLCKTGMGFGDRANSWCGSLPYMAPEIVSGGSYTRAVDWWSVGALLYAMLVGKTPYTAGYFFTEMTYKILNTPVKFPPHISKKGTALLRLLLEKNPSSRLGGSERRTRGKLKSIASSNCPSVVAVLPVVTASVSVERHIQLEHLSSKMLGIVSIANFGLFS
uniref:Protein kinase domain-containing protein n=1 Tax=Leptobrachium leishanense TaxID=445787 RepID=A0A8C5QJA4_9ANUR